MNAVLKPKLEYLQQAIDRLEQAVENSSGSVDMNQGELDLALKKERENTRMVAAKLDSTIERLEALLGQE